MGWTCLGFLGVNRVSGQTWAGGGANALWSNGGNWNNGVAPANNGTAVLVFDGNAGLTNTVDQAWRVNSLQFQAGAGPFEIGGSKLTTGAGGISNLGDQMQRINTPVDLGAAQTWRASGVSGGLRFGGPINNQGRTLTADSATGTRIELAGPLSGSGGVIKIGSGTLALESANTFSGSLQLNSGVLQIGNGAATGSGTLILAGGTVEASGGARSLANAVTLGGDTIFAGHDLVFTGAAQLTGNRVVTVDNATTTFAAPVTQSGSGRTLTKQGLGTLVLGGANSFSGLAWIREGLTIARSGTAFGTTGGGVQIDAGASIALEGGIVVGNESLTLAGFGVANRGALFNLAGDNRWEGNLALVGDTMVAAPFGNLYLGRSNFGSRSINLGQFNLTFDIAGRIEVNSLISGNGSVIKTGTGTLHYRSTLENSYTGSTFVHAGTLILDNLNESNGSIVGPLIVGDGLGGALADIVQLGPYPYANELIDNHAVVTLNSSGWLRLNGQRETVGGLVFNGGAVDAAQIDPAGTASGTLILNGNVTVNASPAVASIAGNLDLGGSSRSVAVAGGGAATGLRISAGIANGALVKDGAGELELTGANSYSGGTTVNAGTLRANNASGSATGSGPVLVAAGAVLTGAGRVNGAVDLQGTVSPGNGVGVLNLGGATLRSGAGIRIELTDADAGAGLGWDFLQFNGVATLTATPLARITLDVATLTPAGAAGPMRDFDLYGEYYWHIARATGGFSGYNELAFDLRTAEFANPKSDGFFSLLLANSDRDLYLVFNPLVVVPEPQTWALLVAGAAGLALTTRRRRR